MKNKFFFVLIFFSGLAFASALSDVHHFADPVDNARYRQLLAETRCPTCQNSDIGESNAPLARQLRDQIAKQIRAGKSNADIVAFLRARYGDFITYNPPLQRQTVILWFAPFVAMLVALGGFAWLRRQKPVRQTLTAREKEQLQQWINEQ